MSVTIGPTEPIVPADDTVLLTNKTTSQFLGDEMGLALKSDVPTKTSELVNDSDFATNASVDEKIGGVTSSIPTKTSQLENDSGFLTQHQSLSNYYTKTETNEAISSSVSSKVDAKYIESEDGKKRIFGNGEVSVLSSTPDVYGPWTDANGNTRSDLQVKLVDPNVPTYVWGNSTLSFFSVAFNSLEEAETATEFEEAIPNRGYRWTRTYTPGTEEWVKEDELSLKSDFDSIATTYATKDELPTKVSQLQNDSNFATKAYVDEHAGGDSSNCVKLNETNELSQGNSVIFHVSDIGSQSTGIRIFTNNSMYGILIADRSIGLCRNNVNQWDYKLDIPEEVGTIATREYVDSKSSGKIKLTICQDLSVDSASHNISILQNYQDNTSIHVQTNPRGMGTGYDTITLDIPLVSGNTFGDLYPSLITMQNESAGGNWYMQTGDKYGNITNNTLENFSGMMLDDIVYARVFNSQG